MIDKYRIPEFRIYLLTMKPYDKYFMKLFYPLGKGVQKKESFFVR